MDQRSLSTALVAAQAPATPTAVGAARLDTVLRGLLTGLASAALLGMVVICFTEVVLRYLFARSLGWYDELAGYLLVWLTFLGAALAEQENRHIGVGIFIERAPANVAFLLKVLGRTLMLMLQLVILCAGALLAIRFAGDSAITLAVSMGLLYAVIPASALLLAVLHVLQIVRLLRSEP